uniref:Chromo domain-containing protein n=1 Tax=Takifugu rubripes TaxID=31033 RepID=A0A674MQM4_TAKRU
MFLDSMEFHKTLCQTADLNSPPRLGQQMWLSSRDLPLQTDSRKLAPRYIGPYPVDKIINPCAVRLRLPASLKIHPPPPTSCATTTPPRLVERHPAYTVNKILDVRRRGRGFQYLVDWEGYGPEERSWIGRSLILDPQLLRDFYLRFPDKPGRTSGGRLAPTLCDLQFFASCFPWLLSTREFVPVPRHCVFVCTFSQWFFPVW